MSGKDLANEYTWGLTIKPQSAASTLTGSGVDFRDCGPEVTALECIGVNPGNDTSMTTKLQESSDNSSFSDITGATFTAVSGDTENQVTAKTFYNRAKRYVRGVVTVSGTSPTALVAVVIGARKVSY